MAGEGMVPPFSLVAAVRGRMGESDFLRVQTRSASFLQFPCVMGAAAVSRWVAWRLPGSQVGSGENRHL